MEILKLNSNDISEYIHGICAIENMCFRSPWSIDSFFEQMELPFSQLWCLRNQDKIVSYCCFWTVFDELHLMKIATDFRYRRSGYADALLLEVKSFCFGNGVKKIDLEVRESNRAAICLYKKHGFVSVGKRKGYYTNPKEDALLMTYFVDECSVYQDHPKTLGGAKNGY